MGIAAALWSQKVLFKVITLTVIFWTVFTTFVKIVHKKTSKNKALILLLMAVYFLPRYDYENVDIDAACEMMEDLEIMIGDKSFVKQRFAVEDKIYQVEKADNFEYTDPVDSTITRNQVHDRH